MSSSGPLACDSPSSGIICNKLETGQAALLGIGDQVHAMPAHATDINAFSSFILQTQLIVNMCFLEGQRQVRVLQDVKPVRSLPKPCERTTVEIVDG
jgi:hypothetical protein